MIAVGEEHDLGGNLKMDGATAESPPMFTLSTGDPLSPREKKLAESLAEEKRNDVRRRCDDLVKGGMPADVVNEVRGRLTRVHRALDGPKPEVSLPAAELVLGVLEKLRDTVGPFKALTTTLSTATPKPNPLRGENPAADDVEHQKWMDEQAEQMYGPGAKAARVEGRTPPR